MSEPNKQLQIESLLEESAEKWRACEDVAERDLLRLVILRELVHRLHAEKSRLLSLGKKKESTSLRSIETKLDELRGCKPLTGDLLTLIEGQTVLKKRTRLLPNALFDYLEREKLERYDRHWEAALASEAIHCGWRIWALEAWVEFLKVEEWNRRLVEMLWPHGVVLFVESAQQATPGNTGAQSSTAWLGRWVCVLHPKFTNPSDISLDFSKWPGTQSTPSWRLLFSPKSY